MTVSRTAKTYQTNRQNFTFSSSQREFNDEWSTASIHRHSTTFRQQILIYFFSKIVGRRSNDVQQCPMKFLWRFENIPIITDDIRQRLRCRAYSGLTRSWCYALLYENLLQFLKNNCVVFILIVLHLIYLVFKNFWIIIIIETSWKIKADEKMAFRTFLATEINKTFQNQLRIVVLFILEALYSLNNILKM